MNILILSPVSQLARTALCAPATVQKFLLDNEIEPDAIAVLGSSPVDLYGEETTSALSAWVSRRRSPASSVATLVAR